MDTRLPALQEHFAHMYGQRNFFVNGSFHERHVHMTRRIGRIADAERKNEPMGGKLARAVSYFMSVVNYFGGALDLTRGMVTKFPSYGCGYCTGMPCFCGQANRPDHVKRDVDTAQYVWKLNDWQTHLFRVYGQRNIDRGFWEVHGRLTSEFGELGILNVRGPDTPITPLRLIEECEAEAADVFSWIIAIAYVKGINLEHEVVSRYQVCPGCNLKKCDCPVVFLSKDGKHFSTVGTERYTSQS